MKDIRIDAGLSQKIQGLALGVIEIEDVVVEKSGDDFWAKFEGYGREIMDEIKDSQAIVELPQVAATRQAYRALGKDPSRYRGSAEALLRRIIKGKPPSKINNVVDINNLVSLFSKCPVGSYDADRIEGEIIIRAGRAGESYDAITGRTINLEGLPVFCDANGPFGSPTSDSARTMINHSTNNALMFIISFGDSHAHLASSMARAQSLLTSVAPVWSVSCWTAGV